MISDARIRLEGRLETLERATAVIESRLPSIRRGAMDVAHNVLEETGNPRVHEAVRLTRAMSDSEPALRSLLKRFARARIRLADTVHTQAKARGVPPLSVRQQVKILLEEPVLYDDTFRNPWAFIGLPIGGIGLLCVLALVVGSHAWVPLPFVAGFGLLMLWRLLHTVRIVVTRDMLVVNGEAIPIRDVERVRLDAMAIAGGSFHLTVRLRHGSTSFWLPAAPHGLIAALRTLGLIATD